MAFVPDEAIVDAFDLSPGAWRLYGYYCMKRNKDSGGWNCPKSAVLKEMPDFTKGTYFRVRKELIDKGWIRFEGDFVTPIKGFKSLKIETPRAENDEAGSTEGDTDLMENEGQEMDENGLKNETNSLKNETDEGLKNETDSPKIETPSLKNETPPLKGFLPAHNTSPLDQDKNPPTPQGEDGLSQKERLELEINTIYAHWQTVLKHTGTKIDESRRKAIIKALKAGYSAADLMTAIDGVTKSTWHMGDNPGKKKHHRLGLIFRDADQIEGFIDLAKGKSPPGEDAQDVQVPAPMSFEEMIFIAYDVNESEPTQENYEATKASYLGESPAAELIAEVENYERGNEYRQRFCKAGQGATC